MSKNQHRADLLELRGELKEETADIRQDVAVLSKNVEHLTQTMQTGFSELRQDVRHLQTAVQRQMRALTAVVAGGVIKVLFFPG